MKPPPDLRARLSRVGALADDRVELAETALTLATIDRPGVAVEPYMRHLDQLAAEVGVYAGGADAGAAGLDLRIEAVRQVIVRRYGYGAAADAYEDPEAANLTRVIDRRRGLPVALGIVYLHVARVVGWPAAGLAFPPRFLVRLDHGDRRAILDPFDGGRELAARALREMFKATAGNHAELTPDDYRETDNRRILIRLQDHAKSRLLRAERLEDAVDAIETMLLFAPREGRLWRELGLLNARLDNLGAAVAALEQYLRLDPADGAHYRTSALLQELRGRLG